MIFAAWSKLLIRRLLAGTPAPPPGPGGPSAACVAKLLVLRRSPYIPPEDLVDAVVARVQAGLVPSALTWFGTGSDPGAASAPMPYAVLDEPDEDDEDLDTAGSRTAGGHLEIHCYAGTKKGARALGDLVAAQLDDAPLLYRAGVHVYLRQSSRTASLDPDPAPGGGDCWDECRQFQFLYSYAVA